MLLFWQPKNCEHFFFNQSVCFLKTIARLPVSIYWLMNCVGPAGFAEPSSPADAAPVLPCGAAGLRRAGREPLSGWMERMLVDLKLVLQSILSHADDLQDRLVNV